MKKEYLCTGLKEHKDKINEFRPWLETLIAKNPSSITAFF